MEHCRRRLSFAVVLGAILPVSVTGAATHDQVKLRRERMVADQIQGRGVRNPDVLRIMRTMPRHLFVPTEFRSMAYEDHPIPIGYGATISQPYIVALMTELLAPSKQHR